MYWDSLKKKDKVTLIFHKGTIRSLARWAQRPSPIPQGENNWVAPAPKLGKWMPWACKCAKGIS
jgi:hypothetical protein